MNHRGSVLIICIGLLSVLLALGLAFLARMRLSATESLHIVREAQARIMLQSACHYLMESSRMGWAPTGGFSHTDAESASLMETCGWTDVRDGSLGPRPVPLPAGTPKPSWWNDSQWPAYSSAAPPVPPPIWWTYAQPYNTAPGAWDAANSDSHLPSSHLRRWPCPGSVVRVDAYRVTRPTYAVVPAYTLNPVITTQAVTPGGTGSWMEPYPGGEAALNLWTDPNGNPPWVGLFARTYESVIGKASPAIQGSGKGALDPQPVANTWLEFAAGDPTPVTSSQNLAWFRIYREVKADHDGSPTNVNDPDRVPLRGYNTFIIACGAGSTHGFRFWDTTDPGYDPAIEPETAQSSGLFPDRAFFEEQRGLERILWFRVEWSGFQGGNVDSVYQHHPGDVSGNAGYSWNGEVLMYGRNNGTDVRGRRSSNPLYLQHLNGVGHILWLQRLDREPPKW